MKSSGVDGPLFAPLTKVPRPPSGAMTASGGADASTFADALQGALDDVKGALHAADKTATEALVGEAAPHEAMIAMAKADLQFRLLTQTRNKLVDAYNELMNLRM